MYLFFILFAQNCYKCAMLYSLVQLTAQEIIWHEGIHSSALDNVFESWF